MIYRRPAQCTWCHQEEPVPTNAKGWCKTCEERDKQDPPERTYQQEMEDRKQNHAKYSNTHLVEIEP